MIIDGDYTDEQLLLTTVQAAKVLGVSRTTVYDLVKAGELRAVHISRSCRISWAELERLVDRLEAEAGASADEHVRPTDRRWRRVISGDGRRTYYPVEVVEQSDIGA